jgi:hypothetical protein
MEPYSASNILIATSPFIIYNGYNIYSAISNTGNDMFPIIMLGLTFMGFILGIVYILFGFNMGRRYWIFSIVASIILYGLFFAILYGRSVDRCRKKNKNFTKIAINSGISATIVLILLILFFLIFQDLFNSPILQIIYPTMDLNNFKIHDQLNTQIGTAIPHIISNGANMAFILYIAVAYSYYSNYCN